MTDEAWGILIVIGIILYFVFDWILAHWFGFITSVSVILFLGVTAFVGVWAGWKKFGISLLLILACCVVAHFQGWVNFLTLPEQYKSYIYSIKPDGTWDFIWLTVKFLFKLAIYCLFLMLAIFVAEIVLDIFKYITVGIVWLFRYFRPLKNDQITDEIAQDMIDDAIDDNFLTRHKR